MSYDNSLSPEGQTALRHAVVEARQSEASSLPAPPQGLPAVRSVTGAAVLGYVVEERTIQETRFNGRVMLPGTPGFMDAHIARLCGEPLPSGWECQNRTALMLDAIVEGNPILLEDVARDIGYHHAFAYQPNRLSLREIPDS